MNPKEGGHQPVLSRATWGVRRDRCELGKKPRSHSYSTHPGLQYEPKSEDREKNLVLIALWAISEGGYSRMIRNAIKWVDSNLTKG